MFMLLPQGDPRKIDFSDVNMKVPFLKVCINGNPKSKLELSLPTDPSKGDFADQKNKEENVTP